MALAFSGVSLGADNPAPKKVQLVFGFEKIDVWEQSFLNVINEFDFADPRFFIAPEFLDFDSLNLESLAQYAEFQRLHQRNADLIVAVQPQASEFIFAAKDSYLPAIPRLYVAPDSRTADLISADGAGILLPSSIQLAMKQTLEMIPRLLPEMEQLYILSGSGAADEAYRATLDQVVLEANISYEIRYIVGATIDELISELGRAPADSAVLIYTYDEDRTGRALNTRNVVTRIGGIIEVPIFIVVDSVLGTGAVGGSVTSARLYGEKAAQAIAAILFDQELPESVEPPTQLLFDGIQLKRWGIDENLLPEGSTIINDIPTAFETYFWQIIGALGIIAIQLVSILALARSLRERDRAKRERDQQIAERNEQEQLFESVINSIPDAIFIADVDARIIATNQGAERLFEANRKQLLGEAGEGLAAIASMFKEQRLADTHKTHTRIEPRIVEFRTSEGSEFTGETVATHITDGKGETVGYFAIIRDVSKRLSMEAEQRQGQKMEALGTLVGGISHDFNNILGVVSGYAEMLTMSNEQEFIADSQNQILDAVGRAKALISQIMAFSRDTNFRQKPIDLERVLADSMKLIRVSIPSNIPVNLKKGSIKARTIGSPIQIQQILINLTSNSYQAMKQSGGEITLALEHCSLATETNLSHGVLQPGEYLVLSVSDTGPGMTKETANRVFEPFFTTKPLGDGSGMGMSIVYNVVKAHNALLDLKTAPGEGCQISIYFKTAEGDAVVDTGEAAAVVRGKGERILLVDDEVELLNATRMLLTRIGYRVTAFSDPSMALEAFNLEPDKFDLLVSDQAMPKLTGVQLLLRAREQSPTLPAVICTGYSELLNNQDAEKLELSNIIRKPYTLSELSRVIEIAIAGLPAGEKL